MKRRGRKFRIFWTKGTAAVYLPGRRVAPGCVFVGVFAACSSPVPSSPPPSTAAACSTVTGIAPEEHGDTIMANQTWGSGPHLVTFDVSVRAGATLTIAPCAVVRMRSNTGLDVREGGTLVAEGTMMQPIRFEPEAAGTTWRPIEVTGQARLAHVTITGGGDVGIDPTSAALWLRAGGAVESAQPVVRAVHVTIIGAAKFGVRLEGRATFTDDSEELTVMGSGQFPVLSSPGGIGSLPSGRYTGNAHDEVLVPGGDIQWDTTLRDRGVPYHVGQPGSENASLRVSGKAVPLLTIDPGVILRFEPHAGMEIEHLSGAGPASGALRVMGTAALKVLFTSAAEKPAAGDWVGISFGKTPDPRNSIDHATIEYAGASASAQNHSCANPAAPQDETNVDRAAVLIFGQPAAPFITNSTIAHSAADGIQRGWFGAAVDFLPSNAFDDIAWCYQSFPRPEMVDCPVEVPCLRGH